MNGEYLHPYLKPKQYLELFFLLAIISVPFAYLLSIIIPFFEQKISIDLWFLDVPSVLGIYLGLYKIFDKYIWKLKFMKRILDVADLNGSWKGVLRSSYDDFAKEYDIEYTIAQTFTKICIYNESDKSESQSTMATLYKNNSKYTALKFEYVNTPKVKETGRLKIHFGVNTLYIKEEGNMLEGRYYTDENRCTFGEMTLRRIF